jgi:post-segregation antitoxin (ccd killing protein)
MPARRTVPLASAAVAAAPALIAAPAAEGQAPAPSRTITATAAGRVTVDRDVAQNSRAIGAAVEAAHDRAVRVAIANAREEAQRLAAAGGLTLGALVSVAEPQPSPFLGGPGAGAYGTEGTFGPGKFCGRIRTAIRRRDARGVLRNTGRVRTRFGCRVSPEVAQTVSATFAVS